MRDAFRHLADAITNAMGTPWALLVAVAVIVAWGASGPLFAFSDTWQLVINTGTTIVTFLMVFVIQASQNRDARATQLKLDELLRVVHGARTEMIDVEQASDETVELHEEQFRELVSAARQTDPGVLDDVDLHLPGDEREQGSRPGDEGPAPPLRESAT